MDQRLECETGLGLPGEKQLIELKPVWVGDSRDSRTVPESLNIGHHSPRDLEFRMPWGGFSSPTCAEAGCLQKSCLPKKCLFFFVCLIGFRLLLMGVFKFNLGTSGLLEIWI